MPLRCPISGRHEPPETTAVRGQQGQMMALLPVDTGQVMTVATFFRVTSLIGVGRYSEVYEAFDTQSQSDVALKLYTGTDPESHALALSDLGPPRTARDDSCARSTGSNDGSTPG